MTLKAAHFPFNESTFSLSQIPTVQSRFEAVRLHKREIQGCDCQRSLMRPQELGVKHGKSSDSVAMVFEKWPAGWADGEDEEGENNKIVQRKDHRVYSTEHLAHQKHLKTFHSSSFSKTWRKKRGYFWFECRNRILARVLRKRRHPYWEWKSFCMLRGNNRTI